MPSFFGLTALLSLVAALVAADPISSSVASASSTVFATQNRLAKRAISTYSGPKAGDATFYGNSGAGGNCLLPARSDLRFAAWPGAAWDLSAQCGACIRVKGPLGTVDVQITNKCPECLPGSLDLSTAAFTKIAAQSAGRVKITWDFIDCAATSPRLETGALSVVWKSGSSAFWMGIQVRGATKPISAMSIKSGSGSFIKLARQDFNYFVSNSGAGAGPFTVQVNFQDGTVQTINNVKLNSVIGDA